MPWTRLVRVLPRVLQTDRRVRADLAEAPLFQPMICPTAFRRTAGLWLETMPRLRSHRAELRTAFSSTHQLLFAEKSSDNVKYGTGSLVTREGSTAHERR